MKKLQGLDRWIGKSLERWSAQLTGGGSQPKEALEIRREILTEIRDRIEPRGDGEYVFPYQEVLVHVKAVNGDQSDAFAAAFTGEGGLESQVKELLTEAGCKGDVAVTVDIALGVGEPFRMEYRRISKRVEEAVLAKRPAAWLHVLKGRTEKAEYFFSKDTVYLGRLKEVASRDGGLRRRNDVAFDDEESTVSREHAHIEYEAGRFRLFHDSGTRGTKLFRDGRAVPVPAGGGRGAQLRSGDEIHLGEARLRFEVSD
jgi:hypothetical protein